MTTPTPSSTPASASREADATRAPDSAGALPGAGAATTPHAEGAPDGAGAVSEPHAEGSVNRASTAAEPDGYREGLANYDRRPGGRTRRRVAAYIALTKPRVIELLLITTLPTMILAQGGWPPVWLMIATLIGGALAAGSANAFNMYIDRDIDKLMNRTKRRPLATGEISPRAGLIFSWILGLAAIAWFALVVNYASAWLAAAAIAIYVVGYTMILKRRTPQNIVWGGIAGCMPVFIGWAAVTGSLSWSAVALFGVIFFWTPPHYWPLSMKFKRDYAAAEVPMLPVVSDDRRVAAEMVGYTIAMIACSLVLIPLAGMSWVYTAIAVGFGAWFLMATIVMLRRAKRGVTGKKLGAMKVFHASITYLSVLFVAVAVDVFLPF